MEPSKTREFSVAERLTGELSIYRDHRAGLTRFVEKKAYDKAIKTLKIVTGYCGDPEAARGCRNILKLIQKTLKELGE